jgi:hypothetical protein
VGLPRHTAGLGHERLPALPGELHGARKSVDLVLPQPLRGRLDSRHGGEVEADPEGEAADPAASELVDRRHAREVDDVERRVEAAGQDLDLGRIGDPWREQAVGAGRCVQVQPARGLVGPVLRLSDAAEVEVRAPVDEQRGLEPVGCLAGGGDQLGMSLGRILRVQATDSRLRRQAAAEERAMKAPIKMLFPTVLFIFPAMFIVILGPALMNISKVF